MSQNNRKHLQQVSYSSLIFIPVNVKSDFLEILGNRMHIFLVIDTIDREVNLGSWDLHTGLCFIVPHQMKAKGMGTIANLQ